MPKANEHAMIDTRLKVFRGVVTPLKAYKRFIIQGYNDDKQFT